MGVIALIGCESSKSPGTDAPPSVSWSRQALIEACVRMHSCGVERLTRVDECISKYEEVIVPNGQAALARAQHLCVNRAGGDCAAVRACFGASASDPECDASYPAGCDGEVRRYCDLKDKRIYRIDCQAGSLRCGLDSADQPFCGAGPCASSTEVRCDGELRRLACNGQGLQIKQCDWIGLKCGLDREQKLDCIGTGKECKG
jgi:hypothetical protein